MFQKIFPGPNIALYLCTVTVAIIIAVNALNGFLTYIIKSLHLTECFDNIMHHLYRQRSSSVWEQLIDSPPILSHSAVTLLRLQDTLRHSVQMRHSAEVSRRVLPGARLILEEKSTVA